MRATGPSFSPPPCSMPSLLLLLLLVLLLLSVLHCGGTAPCPALRSLMARCWVSLEAVAELARRSAEAVERRACSLTSVTGEWGGALALVLVLALARREALHSCSA